MLIAKANGIPGLIKLVSTGSIEAQEYAARALWHLASNPESQVAIADAGGVSPLVKMLSVEQARAQGRTWCTATPFTFHHVHC